MKNKLIIQVVSKYFLNKGSFKKYLQSFDELHEKYNIDNIFFYRGEKLDYSHILERLEKDGIYFKNYKNKEDLIEKSVELSKNNEIVFVYAPEELLIKTTNYIKQELNLVHSEEIDIFRDKSLQRKFLQDSNLGLGVNFLKGEAYKLSLSEIEEKIGYPFIVKPVDGVQSTGVSKITKKKDFEKYIDDYKDFHDRFKARGVDNKELIIEEFIDGELYTMDYFVDEKGEILFSRPVQEILGIDIGFDDYCVVARVALQKVEDVFYKEMAKNKLHDFIKNTVKACKLKNTFVHHEFKLTSKKELKTIELNGRLGGGRLNLFYDAYGKNLHDMIFNKEFNIKKLETNNVVFNIYATKSGKLFGLDEDLFEKIKARPSFDSYWFDESFVGKKTGLTKDGFIKMGEIKLLNKDLEQITKDYEYIKSKYKKILIIKTREEIINERKEEKKKNRKSIFKIIKDKIKNS